MENLKDSVLKWHKLSEFKNNKEKIFKSEILERSKIKILTYNIFLRPPPIKNNKSDYKDQRLECFIKHLQRFDIICLQECFGLLNKRKIKLIRKAQEAGFLDYVESPPCSFFSPLLVDGGLLLLSRFPIVEREFLAFKYGSQSDGLTQKGVIYAKVKINGAFLHLFTTHLQASYHDISSKRYELTMSIRRKQIGELNSFADSKLKSAGEDELIMLLGDLNVNAKGERIGHDSQIYNETYFSLPSIDNYEFMIQTFQNYGAFKVIDLFKEINNGASPVTYGDVRLIDGIQVPIETTLTHKVDLLTRQCLDYIIIFEKNNYNEKEKEKEKEKDKVIERQKATLQINMKSSEIEHFYESNKPFTQLSDHFGLSTEIIFTPSQTQQKLLID